jgi:hypothetical protein
MSPSPVLEGVFSDFFNATSLHVLNQCRLRASPALEFSNDAAATEWHYATLHRGMVDQTDEGCSFRRDNSGDILQSRNQSKFRQWLPADAQLSGEKYSKNNRLSTDWMAKKWRRERDSNPRYGLP